MKGHATTIDGTSNVKGVNTISIIICIMKGHVGFMGGTCCYYYPPKLAMSTSVGGGI